jgi:DNA-binding XRE family transcriptional regulator/5-methylcytosine-specific restriction endonuclease McrA
LKTEATGNKNPNWKGGENIICRNCNKSFHVIPARQKTAKFCSRLCKGEWMSKNLQGENHPRWQINRSDASYCQQCGTKLIQHTTEAISTFRKRKFCSKACADKGGFRYQGKEHPNFKVESRRKSDRGKHGAWARVVISRDNGICRKCGAIDIEVHAHHIEPFSEFPEKRWDISNGITLCYKCHWDIHELDTHYHESLSDGISPVEGYRKGKPSRRWEGSCEWCGAFVSKPWKESKNRAHNFCSKSCVQKYRVCHLTDETRKRMSESQKVAATKYKLARIQSRGHSESTLQNMRKEKKLTQKELATAIGITQGYLSDLENGKQVISEKISKRLAIILGNVIII